jgi:U4/U6 small nuclear ribonucleoprotein PRP4
MGEKTLYGKDAIDAAIQKGNINIAGKVQVEVMDLNAESKESQLQHAENLRKFETRKRARAILVPTAVEEIKGKLRELGHPVTLFGEGPADRRERLREVIAALNLDDDELKRIQVWLKSRSNMNLVLTLFFV